MATLIVTLTIYIYMYNIIRYSGFQALQAHTQVY